MSHLQHRTDSGAVARGLAGAGAALGDAVLARGAAGGAGASAGGPVLWAEAGVPQELGGRGGTVGEFTDDGYKQT